MRGANLQCANLTETDLRNANFDNAILQSAILEGANLQQARFLGADFKSASLRNADLRNANLEGANLENARLWYAILHNANLEGVNLKESSLKNTSLIELNLSEAIGLENCIHHSYSHLHSSTIIQSKGKLPLEFLRGCGLADWEIESAKLYQKDLTSYQIQEIHNKIFDLRTDPVFDYDSCFISYSSSNQYFANKVHDKLQNTGVRCWFDKIDLKTGNRLQKTITDSIRLHDKLILILSQESINAKWVKFEVDKALDRELREDREILFPILMEDIPLTYDNWMETILHERQYLDFRNWQDETSWNQSFEKLLNDLKN